MIKEGGKELKKVNYRLILKIWEEEITPHEWKYGMIFPVLRAVILQCRTYKILASILYVKLVPDAEEITENTKEASKGEDQLFIKVSL
jgi:hypothetical protein